MQPTNHQAFSLEYEQPGPRVSSTRAEGLSIFEDQHAQRITFLLVTHETEVGARDKRMVQFLDGRVVEEDPQALTPV